MGTELVKTPKINEKFACFKLLIRRSKIHRYGVFAGQRIPARHKVIEYTGKRLNRKEAKIRGDGDYTYLFAVDPYWTLDGAVGGSGAEIINHSCNPNLVSRILKGHVLYMSLRTIQPGEELTVDYNFDKDVRTFPCSCGAPSCGGAIGKTKKHAPFGRGRPQSPCATASQLVGFRMRDSAWVATSAAAIPARRVPSRHSALVRVTHWITTLCFLALLVTGVEILISHPRFYWGEAGNINSPALFKIPIPASRSSVPTGYGYVLPDQNGWSRYLHFQAAWAAVLTGLLYLIASLFNGHLRKNLLPADLSWRALSTAIADHLRFKPRSEEEAWSYNLLQRLTYLSVIFVLFPLVIWTGLAMSPAIASVFPAAVSVLGGQQSARTIHFFVTVLLVLFLLVHIMMICLTGLRNRMRAMITGRAATDKESA